MPDILPFHVSFLRTIDTYADKPPMRITNEEGVRFPYGRPGPAPPPPPFSFSATNRGWPKPPTWPNLLHNLRHDEAGLIFARSPVYGSVRGYILSDETAAVLQRFNLGRSDLVWLEPSPDADPTIFRGAWTLWPAERYPTVLTPRLMYEEEPPHLQKMSAFTYDPGRIEVTSIAYGAPWHSRDTRRYLLPCRQPDTGVDLWVDPLWPQSLFLSNRLVDALDAEGLLMGTKDGWRTSPCRSPLPEEIAEDQAQPWIRAITDHEWETIDEETFRLLGRQAGSEANGRAAITSIQAPIANQTSMCVVNVLLTRYDERDMETVFTQNTVPSNLTLRKKSITRMEALSSDLELHIIHLAIPLDHPNIQDLTPNLDAASLPAHRAHIKIVWKTSNHTVYTDAILEQMTQTLVEATIRGFDTVDVHRG